MEAGRSKHSGVSRGLAQVVALVALGVGCQNGDASTAEPGADFVLDCPNGERLVLPDEPCAWAVCGTDNVTSLGGPPSDIGNIGVAQGSCTEEPPGWAVLEFPTPDGLAFRSLLLVQDPPLPDRSFASQPFQFQVDFRDGQDAAPVRFTDEDKRADCDINGLATLPDVLLYFLPSGFCERCADVWFPMGCLGGCEDCPLEDDTYDFEIEEVEVVDDVPVGMSGWIKGRFASPDFKSKRATSSRPSPYRVLRFMTARPSQVGL